MADVLEDSRDKVQENLLANGGTVTSAAHRLQTFVVEKLETYNAISVLLAATSIFLIIFLNIFVTSVPQKPKTTQSRHIP